MRLQVLATARVFLDAESDKILALGPDGYFCLLPHHTDFVSALAEGPLSYEQADGTSGLINISEGLLVKNGDLVLVTTRGRLEPGESEQVAAAREGIEPGTAERGEAAGGGTERPEPEHLAAAVAARMVVASLEAEFTASVLKGTGEDD